MFAYIRDNELIMTSDQLIAKRQELEVGIREIDTGEKDPETGDPIIKKEQYVITPFVDGMTYDKAIEYKIDGPVQYKGGKIVALNEESGNVSEIPKKVSVSEILMQRAVSDLSVEDLQGESFSDFEVGELIIRKFFNSNAHSQTARLAEVSGIQLKLLSGTATKADKDRIAEISSLYADIAKFKDLFYA